MFCNKYLIVLLLLFTVVALGSASMPGQDDEKAKNLQVLPKDISHEALDKIMHEYNDALGVKCGYCHIPLKEDVSKLDYASDEKPAKKIARDMMRMTADINKIYFKDNVDNNGKVTDAVSCISCHNGQEYPAFKK